VSKLISTFKIGFDDETKAEIASLKAKLDAITGTLGVPSALCGNIKPTGGLLAAMQDTAANDAPQPALKQMGQWVFEGQPKEFVTAHVNSFGQAAISSMPIGAIEPSVDSWAVTEDAQVIMPTCLYRELKGKFDATNWQNSAINRETVNDVDYLSESDLDECVPHIADAINQSDWLSESVPSITQADMQLIFIKNLSDVLIQRMHSMGRFSEDDSHVGTEKLMPWDIIYDMGADRFGFVTASQKEHIAACFLKPLLTHSKLGEGACFHKNSLLGKALRTITEDEISNFFGVLEAYHA